MTNFYITEWLNVAENLKKYEVSDEWFKCVLNDGRWTGSTVYFDDSNAMIFESEYEAKRKIEEIEELDKLSEEFDNCGYLSDLEKLEEKRYLGLNFFINDDPNSDFPINWSERASDLKGLLEIKKEEGGFCPSGAQVYSSVLKMCISVFF